MKVCEILNSLDSLPGVGKATASLFAGLNIFTVGDLLQFFPKSYEDRTKKVPLNQYYTGAKVHTVAKVIKHEWFGYGKMKTLKILIEDGTCEGELVAFNRGFLEKSLPVGAIICVTGRFEQKYGKLQSSSFEAERICMEGNVADFADKEIPGQKIVPVYRLTEGLSQKIVKKTVAAAVSAFCFAVEDEIPSYLIEKYKLLHKKEALRLIHIPQSLNDAVSARRTLVYEELFNFQMNIARQCLIHRGSLPRADGAFSVSEQKKLTPEEFEKSLSPRQKLFISSIPFELTEDQKIAVFRLNNEIDRSYDSAVKKNADEDHKNFYSMRALLQGDVGSGKTLVSFFAVLRTVDYGGQAALMAPTEILARQHAENASSMLEKINVKVAFLTGNVNGSGRLPLLKALKSGDVDFVVGTHALFSKNVVYKDLALTIIDEQHRFGVMQRSAILAKGRESCSPVLFEQNLLMMSATPIPQTLAHTVYSDLDLLTIKTMPLGRKEIKTFLSMEGHEAKVYEEVRKELNMGHQAYFVYPAIEKNEDSENENKMLKSAQEAFELLQNKVFPEFTCGLVHGKVDEIEQNKILEDFKNGKIQILVATTVVEVGLDVPLATCMVIEQADRFGLAALHQLRGRVGRSELQSYCFLIYSKKITENGKARMKAIRETSDGFKIAEEDLKLRGPGEITGTAQSGELTFALADIFRDQKIMECARKDAFDLVEKTG